MTAEKLKIIELYHRFLQAEKECYHDQQCDSGNDKAFLRSKVLINLSGNIFFRFFDAEELMYTIFKCIHDDQIYL